MRDSRLTHSPNISLACGAMSLLIEAVLWKGNIGSLAGLVLVGKRNVFATVWYIPQGHRAQRRPFNAA